MLYPGAERRRIQMVLKRAGATSHFRPVDRQGAGQDSSDLLNVSPGPLHPLTHRPLRKKGPSVGGRTQASEGGESRPASRPEGPAHGSAPRPGPVRRAEVAPGTRSNLRLGAATRATGEAASLSACVPPAPSARPLWAGRGRWKHLRSPGGVSCPGSSRIDPRRGYQPRLRGLLPARPGSAETSTGPYLGLDGAPPAAVAAFPLTAAAAADAAGGARDWRVLAVPAHPVCCFPRLRWSTQCPAPAVGYKPLQPTRAAGRSAVFVATRNPPACAWTAAG